MPINRSSSWTLNIVDPNGLAPASISDSSAVTTTGSSSFSMLMTFLFSRKCLHSRPRSCPGLLNLPLQRALSHSPMASSFPPPAVRDLAIEVSTLLKERSESVCVAETVSSALL